MTTPKGYSSQKKEDRLSAEFATVQPVTPNRFGLDTVANCFAFQVATDTVDSSTDKVITAASHVALKGDVIRFTSGAMDKRIFSVWDADANTITLAQTMDAAPAAGSAFSIFRYHPSIVNLTGTPTAAIVFTRDGASQEVVEDTATPANNRPLPVKLTDFSGDMVLNATNLNLEVQLDHNSATPDSVQIGDGTETLSITAAGKAEVDPGYDLNAGVVTAATLRTTPASDSPHLLATRHEASATPIAVRSGNGTNFDAYNAGAADATTPRVVISSRHEAGGTPLSVRQSNGTTFADYGGGVVSSATIRTTPASDSPHLLATRHEAAATPLATELSNGTNFAAFGAGAVGADVLRTTPASDSPHLLATRHEAAATPVATRSGNGTSFDAYGSGASDTSTPRVVLATRHEDAATPIYVRIGNGTNPADFDIGIAGSNTLRVIPASNAKYPMGRTKADGPWRNDYTSTAVTAAAYTEIDASTVADINRLQIFDSSGQTIVLAIGGAGSEVDIIYVNPGGIDIDYVIPAGTRISIKAISATASVGEIVINALQ